MTAKKAIVKKSGSVSFELIPTWIEDIEPERFNNAEIFRIVTFFVFHSSCPGQSALGRALSQYGWTEPWKKPEYLKQSLLAVTLVQKLIYASDSLEDMVDVLSESSLLLPFPSDLLKERIAIFDCQSNHYMSVFYHIRNAFAHGRLNMYDVGIKEDYVFVFEDIATRGKNKGDPRPVSARMILRKNTLLKWIELIEEGPQV